MGIWKNPEEGQSNPVIGQSVSYTDRDFADEHVELPIPGAVPVQLELPFDPALKSFNKQSDELFENFKTVLKGKNVSISDKRQILSTLLKNHRHGASDLSDRSQGLILDVFTDFWNGI